MALDERSTEALPYSAAVTAVLRLPEGRSEQDRLAVEEPLEIRIGGRPVAVTMRTPGHDEELALGFCISEGIPALTAHVPEGFPANTIDVEVGGSFDPETVRRNFYTSSSCGVCGKGALEAVAVAAPRVESDLHVPLALVAALPARLRAEQATFEVTGGLHATGLFVGGASGRFGSPKALAELDGETLAARAWRTLGELCDERLAIGKVEDGVSLPFELVEDGTAVRAPIAGVVAGLRAATNELSVVLPVDVPLARSEPLRHPA